jgi:hypothetical protein
MAEVDINAVLNRVKYELGDAIVGKIISDQVAEKLQHELDELKESTPEASEPKRGRAT